MASEIMTKVSVVMITYNHQDFIKEAIDGVLIQETNFEVELIVADDNSSDDTARVVKTFIENHPKGGQIRYIRHIQNKGMMRNFVWAMLESSGKYIALCEGDDYWTDPLKLQKQFDILENNSNIVVCHHWHKYGIRKGEEWDVIEAPTQWHGYLNQEIATVQDIFENKLRVKTRTMMFRNIINSEFFPERFMKLAFGDVPLNFLLGKHGDYFFINEAMAVYRQTDAGVSTAGRDDVGIDKFRVKHFKNWINIWDFANRFMILNTM